MDEDIGQTWTTARGGRIMPNLIIACVFCLNEQLGGKTNRDADRYIDGVCDMCYEAGLRRGQGEPELARTPSGRSREGPPEAGSGLLLHQFKFRKFTHRL